jgi:heat shock protein HslJ
MGGQARVDGGRLLVTQLATTDMACDPPRMAQDDWLAKVLTGSPTVRLSGPDLVLTSGTTEIRLLDREVADPDRPLVGTRWNVETLVSADVASSVPMGAAAHLVLKSDGTFVGNAGCNEMGGGAAVSGKTIRFSGVFTTKMACDADRTRLEQAVLAVLRDDVSFDIDADALQLRHPSGKGLVLREAK